MSRTQLGVFVPRASAAGNPHAFRSTISLMGPRASVVPPIGSDSASRVAGQSTTPITQTLIPDWKFAAIAETPQDEPEDDNAPPSTPGDNSAPGIKLSKDSHSPATDRSTREELESRQEPGVCTPARLPPMVVAPGSGDQNPGHPNGPECGESCSDEGSGSDSDGEDDDGEEEQ